MRMVWRACGGFGDFCVLFVWKLGLPKSALQLQGTDVGTVEACRESPSKCGTLLVFFLEDILLS